jgi:hypothetical protein
VERDKDGAPLEKQSETEESKWLVNNHQNKETTANVEDRRRGERQPRIRSNTHTHTHTGKRRASGSNHDRLDLIRLLLPLPSPLPHTPQVI